MENMIYDLERIALDQRKNTKGEINFMISFFQTFVYNYLSVNRSLLLAGCWLATDKQL